MSAACDQPLSVFDAIIAEVCRIGKPVNTLSIVISAEASMSLRVTDMTALPRHFRCVEVTHRLTGKQFVIREPRPWQAVKPLFALFQAPQGAKPPASPPVKWPGNPPPLSGQP